MTEPTPTTVADVIAIAVDNDTFTDTAHTAEWLEAISTDACTDLGIDPDMPLSQLREDLAIAARVRKCRMPGDSWPSSWGAHDLLAWLLREGSNP